MSNVFSIAGKGLKLDSAADFKQYAEMLNAVENLKEVIVTGNTFGIGASEALGKALLGKQQLESIDLSDMFTGRLRKEIPESLEAILSSLLTCSSLHTIDLSDNAFGIMTIDPLEKFLSKHTPLEHLILANNGLGPAAGIRIASALEELALTKDASGNSPKLSTIICGRNRLENGSMEAWAKLLAAHSSIKDIRLPQNGIRQDGIAHLLLNGLSKLQHLEKLDLQDNTFTLKGAKALAKTISKWPNLRDLGISDCLLSCKGGELFGDALLSLEPRPSLEFLRLQYNEIEIEAVKKIVDAIKSNAPNLKLLELNGNKFSEDDDIVHTLHTLFKDRGFGELDELDDMEEETDAEWSEESEEDEKKKESLIRDDAEAENSNVAPEISSDVDELASELQKTTI